MPPLDLVLIDVFIINSCRVFWRGLKEHEVCPDVGAVSDGFLVSAVQFSFSEGGSEPLLVFQPFTCLLGGNCCLGLQMLWVVSVAAQTNQLFNPLLQSE